MKHEQADKQTFSIILLSLKRKKKDFSYRKINASHYIFPFAQITLKQSKLLRQGIRV